MYINVDLENGTVKTHSGKEKCYPLTIFNTQSSTQNVRDLNLCVYILILKEVLQHVDFERGFITRKYGVML